MMMTRKKLTTEEALLLQRHVDGECGAGEEERARALLAAEPAARVFVSALEELQVAVRCAEEAAWESAGLASPAEWVALAQQWAGWADAPLDDLAPLLERFHDGEVDAAEGAAVAALLEERSDAVAYLGELSALSAGVLAHQDAVAEADFSNFFTGIAAALDAEEAGQQGAEILTMDGFDAEDHLLLLHRYHDGECDERECARVERWIASGDPEVEALLGAMAELHIGVNAGIETAQEGADFGALWDGLEARLDALDAESAAPNVVSLEARKESREPRGPVWNQPVFALVATVTLILLGTFLGSQLLQQETLVETRTVVIFDSVEYAPGSSVMIHNPQLASHGADADDVPILWVLDDDEEWGDEEWDDDEDMQNGGSPAGPI